MKKYIHSITESLPHKQIRKRFHDRPDLVKELIELALDQNANIYTFKDVGNFSIYHSAPLLEQGECLIVKDGICVMVSSGSILTNSDHLDTFMQKSILEVSMISVTDEFILAVRRLLVNNLSTFGLVSTDGNCIKVVIGDITINITPFIFCAPFNSNGVDLSLSLTHYPTASIYHTSKDTIKSAVQMYFISGAAERLDETNRRVTAAPYINRYYTTADNNSLSGRPMRWCCVEAYRYQGQLYLLLYLGNVYQFVRIDGSDNLYVVRDFLLVNDPLD
tara:strand:- start:6643 stop:7470 length:828 start_codon:yes stop_codon:yes gene_type:complete